MNITRRGLLAASPTLLVPVTFARGDAAARWDQSPEPLGSWTSVADGWLCGRGAGALLAVDLGGSWRGLAWGFVADLCAARLGDEYGAIKAWSMRLGNSAYGAIMRHVDDEGLHQLDHSLFPVNVVEHAARTMGCTAYELGQACAEFEAWVTDRWDALSPYTLMEPMSGAQQDLLRHDTASLSQISEGAFWSALPAQASWAFAKRGLRSWRKTTGQIWGAPA